jgi:hypothetical protein
MTSPPDPPPPGPPSPGPPSPDGPSRSSGHRPRGPRRGERLHTIGAAVVAILAVLAGILIINLLNDPSSKKATPAQPAPVTTPAAAPSTSSTPPASPSPTASPSRASASPSPTPRPSTKPPAAKRPSAKPAPRGVFAPVVIYNNSSIAGLAASAADRVRTAGFDVKQVSGIRGRWPETTVYYDPPQETAAKYLASRVPGIERVQQRPSYVLRTGTLILIVTKDFPTAASTR